MIRSLSVLLFIIIVIRFSQLLTGCAQIMAPVGGAKDTIPPKLLSARPASGTVNFQGNKITLYFNEYIQLDNVTQNLLVSPLPNTPPYVDYKFKNVIIKLRDTLQPNTTYVIDLGGSIKDLNEGNPYPHFSYVFSTGPVIDSMMFSGNVTLAETGGADTTMQVYLYKDLSDTAVKKKKPNYIARVNREGKFMFTNLPAGMYKVYALKDGNGSRTYDSKLEMFGFADSAIRVNNTTPAITLFAYQEEKEKPKSQIQTARKGKGEKQLKYTTNLLPDGQDILSDLKLEFEKPLKNFDKNKVKLTDTLFRKFNAVVKLDSTKKKMIISNQWIEGSFYKLIIDKDFATDTTGVELAQSDTINFKSKKESDYGSVKLTFKNLDLKRNPVLQFVVNNEVVNSHPLVSTEWSAKLIKPGEYELRILYDENKNGVWDPGNYSKKKQPEKVSTIPQKLMIRANWDNEKDITL
jgi:uncharacterized protein (DUF2141 family)